MFDAADFAIITPNRRQRGGVTCALYMRNTGCPRFRMRFDIAVLEKLGWNETTSLTVLEGGAKYPCRLAFSRTLSSKNVTMSYPATRKGKTHGWLFVGTELLQNHVLLPDVVAVSAVKVPETIIDDKILMLDMSHYIKLRGT